MLHKLGPHAVMLQAWRNYRGSPLKPLHATGKHVIQSSILHARTAGNRKHHAHVERHQKAIGFRTESQELHRHTRCMSGHRLNAKSSHACHVTSCTQVLAAAPAPNEVAASTPCAQANPFLPRAGQVKQGLCVTLQGCCLTTCPITLSWHRT